MTGPLSDIASGEAFIDTVTTEGTGFSRATDVTAITNPLPGRANVDG